MRTLIAGTAVLAAVAAATTALATGSEAPAPSPSPRAELAAFQDCNQLVRYARSHALREVVPARDWWWGRERMAAAAPQASPGAGAASDYSTTNVQEAGVDEPDLVKTDGERIFTIARGKLRALDARAETPRELGTLALDQNAWSQELLLLDDIVLVLGDDGDEAVLTEVDVSDPAAMRVVRTLRMDGWYLSARLTGSTARVVVNSTPAVFELPYRGDSPRDARRRVRRAVASAGVRGWLPRLSIEQGGAKRARTIGCGDVRRPRRFSGLDTLTVLTIDLRSGEPVDTDTLMSDADTVYASETGLYLASQRWGRATTTELHKFDTSAPGRTEYRASGRVSGYLLNQFALSEHEGRLRVATTDAAPWRTDVDESESSVSVLEEQAGALRTVGRVGGLGKGERIQSVRFLGDRAYVVTFRQTDPLYTVDLSIPSDPRVAGELKLLGYSAYLHPIGEGLLLGVGQDATAEGRALGTQLSLFDVSDPAHPRRLQHRALGAGWSEAEWDHHAFLYWEPTGLAVLPVSDWESFSGAVGFHVDRVDGIRRVGSVEHRRSGDEYDAGIRRSLVVGERLFTVSDAGVGVSTLATLDALAFVPFA